MITLLILTLVIALAIVIASIAIEFLPVIICVALVIFIVKYCKNKNDK